MAAVEMQRSASGAPASVTQSVLAITYLLALLAGLLSQGANRSPAIDACTVLIALSGLAALIVKGEPAGTRRPFRLGLWIAVLLVVCILLQAIPLPGSLLSAAAWTDVAALGIGVTPTVSIAPAETLAGLPHLAFPLLAFLSGLIVFDTDARAVAAFRLAALAGGGLAVVCLLQFVFFPDRLLFSEKRYYRDSLTFVFVNRNTAATCLGLLALMLFALMRQQWQAIDRGRIAAFVLNGVPLGNALRLRAWLYLLPMTAAVLLSLLLTKSRAGIAVSMLAFLLLFLATQLFPDSRRRKTSAPAAPRRPAKKYAKAARTLGVVALVLAAIAVFGERTVLRGEVQGGGEGRFCMLQGFVSAAASNIAAGGGFATFAMTTAPYRDPACGIEGSWDKAHNVFVDGAVGLGAIFPPLAVLGIVGLLSCYGIGVRQRRALRIYPLLGFCGLVLVVGHGLVDFSLQIPGFAALYAAFAALTVTISLGRSASLPAPAPIGGGNAVRRLHAAAFAALALGLLGAAVHDGAMSVANRDLMALSGRLEAGVSVPGETVATSADRIFAMGQASACRADIVRSSVTVALADLDLQDQIAGYDRWAQRVDASEQVLRHALSCLPGDGNLWLRYAMVRRAAGENTAEQAGLMAMSQALVPAFEPVLLARISHWNRLSAATLSASPSAVEADIRTALAYAQPKLLSAAIGVPSPQLSAVLTEMMALVPQERRALLVRAGLGETLLRKGDRNPAP